MLTSPRSPTLNLLPQAPKAHLQGLPGSIHPLVDMSQAHMGPGTLPVHCGMASRELCAAARLPCTL